MHLRNKMSCTALLIGALSLVPLQAHTPPTDRQITQALANPGLVRSLIVDANAEQSAQVLLRILQRIQASDTDQSQKYFLASFYTARIAFLLVNDAAAMAKWVLPRTPEELLPAVWAGFSVGGRGSDVVMATLRELAGENETWLQAINAPNIPLSVPVYNHLLSALGSAQSLPPVVVSSLPPPIPVGVRVQVPAPAIARTTPPPPIPEPYAGQS